jgi:hypothetical protein
MSGQSWTFSWAPGKERQKSSIENKSTNNQRKGGECPDDAGTTTSLECSLLPVMEWVRGVFTSKIRELPLTQIPQIWTHGKEEHLNLLNQETAVWNE